MAQRLSVLAGLAERTQVQFAATTPVGSQLPITPTPGTLPFPFLLTPAFTHAHTSPHMYTYS